MGWGGIEAAVAEGEELKNENKGVSHKGGGGVMYVLNDAENEMIKCIGVLRYIATSRLHVEFYTDRSLNNCQSRLCRLRDYGVLERVKVEHPNWSHAWRLGKNGLQYLSELVGREIRPYQQLSSIFLPHLIETNEIFFHIAPEQWALDGLSFVWHGSHRAGLEFEETVRDAESGATRRKKRVLRPDAIITPKNSASAGSQAHVFIELDRSTESIISTTGRSNIQSKLRRYRSFFGSQSPSGLTWYESVFANKLPNSTALVPQELHRSVQVQRARPVLLFVVPTSRRKSGRKISIERLIEKFASEMMASVHCVTADDITGIRKICGSQVPQLQKSDEDSLPALSPDQTQIRPIISYDELVCLQQFYQVSLDAYRRLHADSSVRPKFRTAAEGFQQTLVKLAACYEP